MRNSPLVIISLLLMGCVTTQTGPLKNYIGSNIDDFIEARGSPLNISEILVTERNTTLKIMKYEFKTFESTSRAQEIYCEYTFLTDTSGIIISYENVRCFY